MKKTASKKRASKPRAAKTAEKLQPRVSADRTPVQTGHSLFAVHPIDEKFQAECYCGWVSSISSSDAKVRAEHAKHAGVE